MEEYVLKFLDIERRLPLAKTPGGVTIAGFNPVGDMEVLEKSALDLARQLKDSGTKCDIILTTELKGIPIAQELARLLKVDYVCLRKEAKCYMVNARQTEGESITSGKTNYFISEIDENKLKGKNVVFADDVFSTGSTFISILKYAQKAGFTISCCAAILKEDTFEWEKNNKTGFLFNGVKVFYCGFLPLQ